MKCYIDNGLDKKYLQDPDNGINLMKKKAELRIIEKSEPELRASFPEEDFKADLSGSPKVLFGTIWKYINDAVDSKKKLSTDKPLAKGFNFYKSGNVISMSFLKKNGKNYFKSQVIPSMKKNFYLPV